MSSKEIRVPQEVYDALEESRREGETVEDVVRRLATPSREHPLYDIVGLLDDAEAEDLRTASRRAGSDIGNRVTEDS